MRLVAAVPPDAAVAKAAGTPAAESRLAVLVIEADLDRPDTGVVLRGFTRDGTLARETWYITVEEAQTCAARDFEGLGEWQPMAEGTG